MEGSLHQLPARGQEGTTEAGSMIDLAEINRRYDAVCDMDDAKAQSIGAALAYALDVPVLMAALREAHSALAEIDMQIGLACPLWALTYPDDHTGQEVADEVNPIIDGLVAVLARG